MLLILLSKLLLLLNIVCCMTLTIIILLQRGEEGMFTRVSRFGQIKTNSNTLKGFTIIISLVYIIIAMSLTYLFYYLHFKS